MAFTGTAVVEKVSDRCFRVTGLSFAGATTGTITVGTGDGAVDLGETDWGAHYQSALADRVKVTVVPAASMAETEAPCYVTKAGTVVNDLVITIGCATAHPAMEIWIELM